VPWLRPTPPIHNLRLIKPGNVRLTSECLRPSPAGGPTVEAQASCCSRTGRAPSFIDPNTGNPANDKSPSFTSRNFRDHAEPAGVFDGFRTENAVREAEAAVAAGNQNLLAVEQEVLLNAATAYMNVLRDREIVTYRRQFSSNSFDEAGPRLPALASMLAKSPARTCRSSPVPVRSRGTRSDLAVAIGNLAGLGRQLRDELSASGSGQAEAIRASPQARAQVNAATADRYRFG
jgi:hypothetical protein